MLGGIGVLFARIGVNTDLFGHGLPDIPVPSISLPGLATTAQLREQQTPGVALESNQSFLTARSAPETSNNTQLRSLATPAPSVAGVRTREDVVARPASATPEAVTSPASSVTTDVRTTPPANSTPAPIQVPAAAPEKEATNSAVAAQKGPSFDYIVLQGDTISGIAAKFGVTQDTLLGANLEILGAPTLKSGQRVRVLLTDGVLHPVQSGETLSELALRHGITIQSIVGFAPNGLKSADDLRTGTEILLPGAKVVFPVPAAPQSTSTSGGGSAPQPTSPSAAGNPFSAPPPGAGGVPAFIWPFPGPISSYYGPGHPLGIDIDGFANPSGSVSAAAAGTVTFAGGSPCCSYGFYIIIRHSGGFQTLYGHLSRINVTDGQNVAAGEVIGTIGNTGYSTGIHLHFEIRQGNASFNQLSPLNPMVFLP